MKLEKKTMPLLKEWADVLLFANYKTMVMNVDGQGATKGKNKAQGNQRVMYTTRTPWWDAKNRHNLQDELPFSFSNIAHILNGSAPAPQQQEQVQPMSITLPKVEEPKAPPVQEVKKEAKVAPAEQKTMDPTVPDENYDIPLGITAAIPPALAQLMRANNVSTAEIQEVVGQKGYYPADTPIANYDPGFIQGVLVAAWNQVFEIIKKNKENLYVEF